MPESIACGELLIDFISTRTGVGLAEAPAFEKVAGGAPANVAVGLARLGVSSGFLGKVGADEFGRFLSGTLRENGVDVSGLRYSEEARTGLAFVSLGRGGEREFMFYRHPSADMLWDPSDVDPDYIASARLFHYGSITLGAERSRAATLHALDLAREAGLAISYDPNLRFNLWPSREEAYRGAMLGWSGAHIIKISIEEATFFAEMAGHGDPELWVRENWSDPLRLLVVTEGPGGCLYYTGETSGHVPGFDVDAVDTTGAGDSFFAALLARFFPHLDRLLSGSLTDDEIRSAVRYANAAGAITTTRRGAIPALPASEEVEGFLGAYA
jgi:fructokinase